MPIMAGSSIVNLDTQAVVDLTKLALFTDADMTVWDQTAYDALNVDLMAAGESFADPVTGVLTTKITDSTTPVSSPDWVAYYSTLGLQISQAWGAGKDKYTLGCQNRRQ